MNENKFAVVHIGHYVDKLLKAWHKYEKIIICVDFDDTIKSHNDYNKNICENVLKTIKEAYDLGATLILWTCRRYEDIETSVMDIEMNYGMYFHEINPTEPFKENFSNKPYCNIMLDDKCGLEQSLAILTETIKLYKNELIERYKNETNNIKGCKS